MSSAPPVLVSRLELRALRLAVLLSGMVAVVLVCLLVNLGARVARAEAAEREVTDRLLVIYERVRRVQLLVEKRNEVLGIPPPAEPAPAPAKPDGR